MMADLDALVARAHALSANGRALLGITGAPGAGKSTLAERLVSAVDAREPGSAVLVGMDGFHLAQAELDRLGRAERKGAPDTFDAGGYVALLRRLREDRVGVVYAPRFRREIEEPIACAVPVPPAARLVVTEGNYLLVHDGGWAGVRPLLDECWYVDVPDDVRRQRLAARHELFGRTAEQAWQRTLGSDERNAVAVRATRDRADLLVRPG